MTDMTDTLALAAALIEKASITPSDGGCHELLFARLQALGFTIESLPFGEVSNFWARLGNEGPVLAFAGHTDVVPPGPAEHWDSAPFTPTIRDGFLYGRGAADMKGSIAAFVTAVERFLKARCHHAGSIALLLTSDEEGPAVDGTVRVVDALRGRGERIDYCLVGEPTSRERCGDTIKIGRRGSLSGRLRVLGEQGHVAYPQLAENPIHTAAPALAELAREAWDRGNESFPATSFQISNVRAGTGAGNVIPGQLEALFNFRFSPELTEEALRARTHAILDRHGLRYELDWELSALPFLTARGDLVEAVRGAVREITGGEPALSTDGGTSDGRFLAPTGAQVVELGPVNRSIHKIDEHVGVEELDTLSEIYGRVLERLL